MNQQQLEIIEGFGQGQAVIAGAGCGKTTTLVAKCVRLLQLNPQARFCAVSFTEKSVRDLKQNLASGFQKARLEGTLTAFDQHDHWVKTIHGLSYSIIQEFPEAAGLAGGERILLEDEAEKLWKRSVDQLWSQNDNLEITDAIGRLMRVYSKSSLESLLAKLRNLEAFGVEAWIEKHPDGSLADLWLVFESVRLRYTRYKQRAGALDFNDLELFASQALDEPRVQKYYQKRFDLVLVDEFQDTNPVQGKILEKFVRPGHTNLCIVGDPKQSIYRFRDADVTVFQDLTRRLAKRHPLTTNYRSRPAIIDFVNQVCDPLFTASEMEYEPLIAGRDEQEKTERVFQLQIQSERELARFLKQEVEAGRELSDYVMLARSVKKDQTLAYLNAFEAEGIPFVFGSGGRFFSDPRVIELAAFLKGWLSKNNSLSQVAALRSPWIAVDDQTLLEWKNSGKSFYECFFETKHPVALALKPWFVDRVAVRPGEILEKLWGLDSMAEEMLLPLATLWQKVEDLSAKGTRFHEVTSQLERWIENEKIESDIPPPDQKGAVKVMTVHAAKGLQFPRVILIDFEKPAKSDGRKDLLWNREHGVFLFEVGEDGKRLGPGKHPENDRWRELEKRADVSESKRVFYVALTRAQEALYFVWKQTDKEGYKERDQDLVRDYWRSWIAHLATDKMAIVDCHAIPPSPQTLIAAEVARVSRPALKVTLDPYRPRHSPSEWLILHQCPLRYHFEYAAGVQNDRLDFTDSEKGPDLLAVRTGQSVSEKGEKVHKLIEDELWEELVLEFANEEVGQKIVEKLRAALDSEKGKVFKEVGFEVPFSRDEALVGVMDRLVLNESNGGAIQVTDYKFTGSPRSPQKLLDHYLLQLQLYAWAALRMTALGPRPIRARLIHFTKDTIEIVQAPELEFAPERLENVVNFHFELSKKLLFHTAREPLDLAQPGDHCRYCPHQTPCPKSTSKVDAFGIV